MPRSTAPSDAPHTPRPSATEKTERASEPRERREEKGDAGESSRLSQPGGKQRTASSVQSRVSHDPGDPTEKRRKKSFGGCPRGE
jgi:hypothetical protein